ncbi:MAG: YraN family protein [Candidatus Spechtbacterales bacterium]
MPSKKRKKGDTGEEVAFSYLKDHGYKVLERNYANKFGEIDIVAQKDKTVVFVEVKSQYGLGGELYPERNVDWRKQGKLIRAAEYYLIKNKYPDDTSWQIDVIGVELDTTARRANLRHLKNAIAIN